jgi:predicted GNAT family acetyltransferase
LSIDMTDSTRDGRPIEVADNPQHNRFEAVVGDEIVGKAVYLIRDGVVVFTHTEVDPEEQGQGIAQVLAGRSLDLVRGSGRTVVAQCPFIATYIRRHPEYADLLGTA